MQWPECRNLSIVNSQTYLHTATFMHWRRKWQPTPVFLPGESQGRRSLVGCRLWGRTELDTTEVTQQQMHSTLCCAKSLQSCLTLCNAMDCSPLGFSVHGILQAGILEWVAISSSRGSSNPGTNPTSLKSPALAGRFFVTSTTWEAPIRRVI